MSFSDYRRRPLAVNTYEHVPSSRMQTSPTTDELVGAIVKQLRQSLGMSQDVLANRMTRPGRRWHQTTVGRVEAGTRPLSLSEAIELSNVLGVDVPSLYTPADGAYAKWLIDLRAAQDEVERLTREHSSRMSAALRVEGELMNARVRAVEIAGQFGALQAIADDPAEAQKLADALVAAVGGDPREEDDGKHQATS